MKVKRQPAAFLYFCEFTIDPATHSQPSLNSVYLSVLLPDEYILNRQIAAMAASWPMHKYMLFFFFTPGFCWDLGLSCRCICLMSLAIKVDNVTGKRSHSNLCGQMGDSG